MHARPRLAYWLFVTLCMLISRALGRSLKSQRSSLSALLQNGSPRTFATLKLRRPRLSTQQLRPSLQWHGLFTTPAVFRSYSTKMENIASLDTAVLGNYELLTEFKLDYAPVVVSKLRSKKTGFSVVVGNNKSERGKWCCD